MKKNKNAHKGESGICKVADGQAKNAKPGPDAATSSMFFSCSCAIKPTIENITKPAKKEVPELIADIINASLIVQKVDKRKLIKLLDCNLQIFIFQKQVD